MLNLALLVFLNMSLEGSSYIRVDGLSRIDRQGPSLSFSWSPYRGIYAALQATKSNQ